jgi:RNA polymerase sigma-70 factor (ECF subfamily)
MTERIAPLPRRDPVGATAEELALRPGDLDEAASSDEVGMVDLVRRARRGDRDAFGRLISRYERMVFRTALRLLGRADAAQDAAQETFLRLFRYLDRFDESRELAPWLYRVVVNVCRDLGKKASAARLIPLDEIPEPQASHGAQAQIEDTIHRAERLRMVQEALLNLPEKERAAVVLRDLEGWSTAEVARILGSSEGTVRSQVSTARVKIKRFILGDQEQSR